MKAILEKMNNLPTWVKPIVGISIIPFALLSMPFVLVWFLGFATFDLFFESQTKYLGVGVPPMPHMSPKRPIIQQPKPVGLGRNSQL